MELVLMCKDKPTEILLNTVKDNVPFQIQKLTEEKYQVEQCVDEASIAVQNTKKPTLTLKVTLTSPIIRDELEKKDGENVVMMKDTPELLDRQKCLNTSASLRHAKWFQALRQVMEGSASGIQLPEGPGLHDPCEPDPTDALSYVTVQQKEDITHGTQHALRLSAFGQTYKVLEMDPIPSSKPFQKYS
ncbi:Spermatid perinuclear RNA-binding protein [Fukomys damarensis]|uniref:Spermatid perinuclear RNA-binding protein n=1 Tax=Fukomys damarensis TaxID=885580 RepID=A0A091CK37_FUKDA|nr:Spermatid perinuclear RNA-binding protein [Fukomys damarensis]